MNIIKKIQGFFSFCFIAIVVCSRLASAGVPSPIPEAAPGTQLPEHLIANLGDFKFENGEVVRDFKVSYTTYGKLNEKKDNVVLAMHSSWGTYRQMEFLIGPGKALDTENYFIVAPDRLGNASALPDITTGPTSSALKMKFPRYSMRDSLNIEYKLIKEHLGFDHILAATGISIGGMKAYQFGVSYPDYVSGLIPIAGAPRANPQMKALLTNLCRILELDPGWYAGNYESNPVQAVHIMLLNYIPWFYTPEWFAKNLTTEEQYQQWAEMWNQILHFYPQDARDWYYTHLSWADYDIGYTPGFKGDTEAALKSIKARLLIIASKGDMLERIEDNRLARDLISNADYLEIDNPWGHMICCGWDPESTALINREVAKFLSDLKAGNR